MTAKDKHRLRVVAAQDQLDSLYRALRKAQRMLFLENRKRLRGYR